MAIYGGTDGNTYDQQRKGLKMGADVVIATPGRLLAHLSMGHVDLSKVSFLFSMRLTGCLIWVSLMI